MSERLKFMKTHKLKILEKQIRKDLPRLMELREGIILKSKVHNSLYADYVVLKALCDDYSYCAKINGKHNSLFSVKNEDLLKEFEIIGHDILLSDVLEWLSFIWKENIDDILLISLNGDFIKIQQHPKIDWDYYHNIKLNLSKPYLKDQSKEFICFLYDLKNKQHNIVQNINNKGTKIGSMINIGNINGNVIL